MILILVLVITGFVNFYPKISVADSNNLGIYDINTIPDTIHVGDVIRINATLVNNTPNIISVHNVCISPFTVGFDKNVKVNLKEPCRFFAITKSLKAGEKMTVTGPGSNLEYIATHVGTTNASITFSYGLENASSLSSLSKSILFTIYENNASGKIIFQTPLKQIKSGISPSDVKCNSNLQLIFKTEDKSPACVRSLTKENLIARGWATSS